MNLGIRHAALGVRDLERALAFYRELGFEAYYAGDADWAMVEAGGTTLSLVHSHPPHIGAVLDSPEAVDKLHAALARRKLPGLKAPVVHRDQSYGFYFTDTEGNQLEAIFIPAVARETKLPKEVVLFTRPDFDAAPLLALLAAHAPQVRWSATTTPPQTDRTVVALFTEVSESNGYLLIDEGAVLNLGVVDAIFSILKKAS